MTTEILKARIAKLRQAIRDEMHTAPRVGTPCMCVKCWRLRRVLAADRNPRKKATK